MVVQHKSGFAPSRINRKAGKSDLESAKDVDTNKSFLNDCLKQITKITKSLDVLGNIYKFLSNKIKYLFLLPIFHDKPR